MYANYTEKLLVGYRYYDAKKIDFTTGDDVSSCSDGVLLLYFSRCLLVILLPLMIRAVPFMRFVQVFPLAMVRTIIPPALPQYARFFVAVFLFLLFLLFLFFALVAAPILNGDINCRRLVLRHLQVLWYQGIADVHLRHCGKYGQGRRC